MLAASFGPAAAQERVQGRLHTVWDAGDGASGHAEHFLVDATGAGRRIQLEGLTRAGQEALIELDRSVVEIGGAQVRSADGAPLLSVRDPGSLRAMKSVGLPASGVSGGESLDFVTVLCRFADDPAPAFTRADVVATHGDQYPGVRHFFGELSWNPTLMRGSRVTEWYTLPRTRSHYVSEGTTDFGKLATDCTRAAEQDIHFPAFFGINLQFSSGLSRRLIAPFDTLSFGGSWTLSLNGASRTWGVTWLSASHARDHVVVSHEIGHALGWPHSSGEHGEFDSEWDIMSRGFVRWEPPYGWLGVHTIAPHKDAMGWVPAARRWTPAWGRVEQGLLTRTALPSSAGSLLARVPISDNSYYTVELRQTAGHDRPLPGEAAVIHRVQGKRAYVVDVDGNGNPNDAGAQWQPGKEFQDSIRGFSMRVDSAGAEGFHITITRGWRLSLAAASGGSVRLAAGTRQAECHAECDEVITARGTLATITPVPANGHTFVQWEGDCSGAAACSVRLNGNRSVRAVFVNTSAITVEGVIDHLFGRGGLTDDQAAYLDRIGNGNGRVDIADVRRWIESGALTPTQMQRARAALNLRDE